MASRQAVIQEDTYFRIMVILDRNPDLTQRELARQVGMSLGGVNYCLRALMEKGWVKVQSFSQSKNMFGYMYLLTPAGIAHTATLTGRFLQRKLSEYEALRAEIEVLRSEAQLASTAREKSKHVS